ncbi:MAG: purine-nucleoside phosphorylase [Brumimicrobium sp.]
MELLKMMNETADFLKSEVKNMPVVGIILGTGLGGLAQDIEVEKAIPYEKIPNFPVSTVKGHSGKLVFGKLGGKNVVAMQGRFHFYEGYTLQQVTFPVRVMKALGIQRLIVSNASGGVNPEYEIGEIMLISDHINFFPGNPLIGKNVDELGPRFPDMSDVYDAEMLDLAEKIANKHGIQVKRGVYLGLTGPTLETPAEYKMVRILGADAVGMSTVPEVIVARHMDIPCFAVSIVTDLGVEGKIVKVSGQDVIDVANKQEAKMTKIIEELIETI